ncbi:MAG: hypothetical protein QM777_06025 [Pseudorhodoferax sp.]
MAQFAVGQSIATDTPGVTVDAGLAVGSHRFSLVVLDAAGLRSRVADELVVQVQRLVVPDRPIPVDPVRPPPIDPAGPVITPVVTPVVTPVNPPVVAPVRPVVTPVRTPQPRRPR